MIISADSFTALLLSHQDIILRYRYAILFGAAVLEGMGTLIAAGALIAAGIFQPVYAMIVCTVSETVSGFLWYSVGYFFGSKPIDAFVKNSPVRQSFMTAVRHHSDRAAGLVVLIAKLTYSVTNAVLILIGSLKYSPKRFAFFNVIGSIGWAAILLTLGYMFGHAAMAYLPIFKMIALPFFFIMCLLVTLLALKHFGDMLIQYLRKSDHS